MPEPEHCRADERPAQLPRVWPSGVSGPEHASQLLEALLAAGRRAAGRQWRWKLEAKPVASGVCGDLESVSFLRLADTKVFVSTAAGGPGAPQPEFQCVHLCPGCLGGMFLICLCACGACAYIFGIHSHRPQTCVSLTVGQPLPSTFSSMTFESCIPDFKSAELQVTGSCDKHASCFD